MVQHPVVNGVVGDVETMMGQQRRVLQVGAGVGGQQGGQGGFAGQVSATALGQADAPVREVTSVRH